MIDRDDRLPNVVEELYQVFANYRFTDMDGDMAFPGLCDPKPLLAKPLRLLPAEAFDRFAWKTMTTWGAADDFRHFLPRMLELYAVEKQEPGHMDCEFLYGKLCYGKWLTWPEVEIKSIERFIRAWWLDVIYSPTDIDQIEKIGEHRVCVPFWDCSYDNPSFFLHNLSFLHHAMEDELKALWADAIEQQTSIGPVFNLAKAYVDKNDYELDQLDDWHRQPVRAAALFAAWEEHQDQEPLASFFSEAHSNADQIAMTK